MSMHTRVFRASLFSAAALTRSHTHPHLVSLPAHTQALDHRLPDCQQPVQPTPP